SPVCSSDLICWISSAPSSGKRSSNWVRSREMSTVLADACVNRSKNSRRWGVKLKRMVRAASYHVGGELAGDAEPAARAALGLDRAARRRHDVLDDREPEPRS